MEMQTTSAAASGSEARSKAIITRYSDAYLLARLTTGIGQAIKVVGVILFLLLTVAGVYLASVNNDSGIKYCMAFVFGGAVIGVPFYALGVLIASQGEVLNAILDTAVHSTPFLTDDEKATAMSLPGASPAPITKPHWSW